MNFPVGSLWRKWDLHFHTPASFDYENKSITNQELIDNIDCKGINLVTITDHHTIDIPRIAELMELAKEKHISILPGIEFRSELGGSESVHFIGIFPEDLDQLSTIWENISGTLNISQNIKNKGVEGVYFDLKDTAKLIHENGGIVSIHAGNKSNSVENIRNNKLFKMAQKQDLLNESIDILEINRIQDIDGYKNIVFPSIQKELPIIICSDNHNCHNYNFPIPCWIKADTTFVGLQQIIHEPDRVYIGDNYPKQIQIQHNTTKYIKTISIHKLKNADCAEHWFDCDLEINPDLVAIIGNKGNGKSALLDIIGLLGNSHVDQEYFSFLHEKHFCKQNNKKSQHFKCDLAWRNGSSATKILDESADLNLLEQVRYIPQSYFEVICNEIAENEEGKFDNELKNVIFSHVSPSDRLNKETLNDLIQIKTDETVNSIQQLKIELNNSNETIIRYEQQTSTDYGKKLYQELEKIEKQLSALDKEKPSQISAPNDQKSKQINDQISELSAAIESKENEILETNQKDIGASIKLSTLTKIKEKFENFQEYYMGFENECSKLFEEENFNFHDLVKLNIDLKPVLLQISEITAQRKQYANLLDGDVEKSIMHSKNQLEKEKKALQFELNEPNRLYQNYIKELSEWEQKKKNLIGDVTILDTFKYYESKISSLTELPELLRNEIENRNNISKKIFQKIVKIQNIYEGFYEPVQTFIQNHPLGQNEFPLQFDVSIINNGFPTKLFEDFISHGSSGSFCGKDEGEKLLLSILDQYNFNNEIEVQEFTSNIMRHLQFDCRSTQEKVISIQSQLRKNAKLIDLYNFIFSFDYLRPRFILKMGDKEINQLSPGEKGALLLVFYLLVDKAEIPIVIDQPEHNLDNETIYNLLVKCIKEAKKKRQVFIVTHNPNLAVVCDAEQIIIASLDKKNGNKVSYLSGAIENPIINKKVIDILEGTRPAFNNRRLKYFED